jgi:hypothetical protein
MALKRINKELQDLGECVCDECDVWKAPWVCGCVGGWVRALLARALHLVNPSMNRSFE